MEMADELEESEDALRPLYEAFQKKGADCPAEEVYAYLNTKSWKSQGKSGKITGQRGGSLHRHPLQKRENI